MRFVVALILALAAPCALSLPQGMSFIGLKDGIWTPFIVDASGKVRSIDKVINPRQMTWAAKSNRIVYLDASGAVMEFDIAARKSSELVSATNPDAFTQLRLSPGGNALWAVRLKDRQSETASLEVFNQQQKRFTPVHAQRGANFDPYIAANILLYTHVSCVVGCGQLIQEVWMKDTVTGVARQVTLLNALSRHPVWDAKQNRIVFSSNQSGDYQLWSVAINGDQAATPSRLTSNSNTNIEPVIDSAGKLYWIQRKNGRGYLMEFVDKKESVVTLPGITDIRDLEITP
jgi:hypothetical protein